MNYQPPSQPPQAQNQPQTSGLAIATIVCGLGSWVMFPFIASVIGVITGWMELGNIKAGRSAESNRLLTQIGFWASVANILTVVASGCLIAAFYFGFFSLLGLGALAGG